MPDQFTYLLSYYQNTSTCNQLDHYACSPTSSNKSYCVAVSSSVVAEIIITTHCANQYPWKNGNAELAGCLDIKMVYPQNNHPSQYYLGLMLMHSMLLLPPQTLAVILTFHVHLKIIKLI